MAAVLCIPAPVLLTPAPLLCMMAPVLCTPAPGLCALTHVLCTPTLHSVIELQNHVLGPCTPVSVPGTNSDKTERPHSF